MPPAVQGDVDGLSAELPELWATSGDDAERHRLLSLRVFKQDRTWDRYWQARRSRTSVLAALAA